MTLTLNIVYTPGTVAMLGFMVRSLLHWSDCSFRLISNACLPPEQRFLKNLAEGHPRLTFCALPTHSLWPHGRTLDYLHRLTPDDLFGFLDSDIFATGEFLPALTAQLKNHAAVFTGAPVWARSADQIMPADFQVASGPYNRTATGTHIGCTYCAIYDNRALRRLLAATAVSFSEATRAEIPAAWRAPLATLGLAKQSYDTGKLLNALLIAQGHSLRYVETPMLVHLGGSSFVPLSPSRRPQRWWADLPGVAGLRALRDTRGLQRRFRKTTHSQAEIQAEIAMRLEQRNVVRQHFWSVLQALATRRPLPPLPTLNAPELRQPLEEAVTALLMTYERFADGAASHSDSPPPLTTRPHA